MEPPFETQNSIIRNILRVGAILALPAGAIFSAIGLIDFFGAFSGQGFPTKFWCVFIGFPLLALGSFCFKAGFLRAVTGYVAGESAPAVREAVEYVAEGLAQSPRSTTGGSRPDPAERMKKLEELRRQGLITDAEYSEKRQQILLEL